VQALHLTSCTSRSERRTMRDRARFRTLLRLVRELQSGPARPLNTPGLEVFSPMKLALALALALAAPLAAVIGCTAPVASTASTEDPGKTSSALTLTGGGLGLIALDPTVACASTPAKVIPLPPAGEVRATYGLADLTASCSYALTEVTGVDGNELQLWISDQEPGNPPNPETGAPLVWASTEANCTNSYASYDVFGYTTPEFTLDGDQIVETPPANKTISESLIVATWSSENGGTCTLRLGGTEVFVGEVSGFSTITVASAIVVNTPSGLVSQPVYTYVIQ
jgi:hypothetical protein